MNTLRKIVTSVRLDPNLHSELSQYAKANKISVSKAVNKILKEFFSISEQSEGNPLEKELIQILKKQLEVKDEQIKALTYISAKEQRQAEILQIETKEKVGFWRKILSR